MGEEFTDSNMPFLWHMRVDSFENGQNGLVRV
jgi:hypothetical protein